MKTKKLRVLIIEDSSDDYKLILRELEKGSYEIENKLVGDAKELEKALLEEWDVIVSDYSLPGFTGNDALKICNEKGIDVPFIIVSGTVGEEIAVGMMKAGAKDYIMKNKLARLLPAVEREIEEAENRKKKKQADIDLLRSREKYHTIFESTGTATMIVEEDKTISMVNKECVSLTGYSSDELLGTKWPNYVAPESLALMMKYDKIRREDPTKAPKKYEANLINKKGEIRNTILDIGFIKETRQRVVSMLDITERKRTEEELKKSQLLLLSSLESQQDTILFSIDKNYKYLFFNKAHKDVMKFVYNSDIITGTNILDYISSDEDRIAAKKNYDRALNGESHSNVRIYGDVELAYYESFFNPIVNENNDIVGATGLARNITERKQAEEELKKSKQNWQGIFHGISHPTVILDAQHNILEINNSLREKLGKELSEIMKLKCWEIFHAPGTSCPPFGCPFEQMVINGSATTTEMEMEAFGGYYLINCTPLFDEEGKLEKVIHIATDITERKKTEIVLQEIISKNPMSIQIVDNNGYTISTNAAHTNLFGTAPPPEFTIFNDSQLENQGFKELFERVKKGEIVHFPDSYYNVHDFNPQFPDNPFWVRGIIFPLMDSSGNPERFVLMQDDITEQKKAEEKLISSEAKYRNLIETMPEGFYRSSPDGYFVDVNPALVNMLGFDSREELLKVHIPEELYFSSNERIDGVSFNTDFSPDTEIYRLRKKDGSEIWVEDHARYIKDETGNILYHEGIIRDVTESLRVHNAILEAKEKAEEANEMKSSFLANMSHEIRTPLNGILGFTEILRSELTNPEHIRFTEVIEKSGRRLLETLHLILTFAKLDAEKQDINYSNVKIENAIDETIQTYEAMAKTKNLYLKSVILNENIYTKSDERFLQHILNNLVNNAIKYTHSGGVTVELSKESKKVFIKVIDTGIGIAKDKQEIIFEEFRQESEGFSRNFEGTGLGLSITKKFTELMKGKIYVESEPGKGSTFIVELPYESFSESINIKLGTDESGINETISESRFKTSILIVEDDEDNRLYIENILAKYNIFSVKDGPAAIQKAKEKVFDIVLMDMNLGSGMDGIAVTKEIRKLKKYKNTPIAALTAFVLDGDKEEFLNAGCNYYLGKPFNRKQLIDLINEILLK